MFTLFLVLATIIGAIAYVFGKRHGRNSAYIGITISSQFTLVNKKTGEEKAYVECLPNNTPPTSKVPHLRVVK